MNEVQVEKKKGYSPLKTFKNCIRHISKLRSHLRDTMLPSSAGRLRSLLDDRFR